jgi:hypothetical protein
MMQVPNQLSEENMKRIGSLYLTVFCVVAQLLFPLDGWTQLIHTAHDHIPDFSANFTISSSSNGPWSSPNTWSPARVPGSSDIVRIRHTVTYDSATGDADVIGIDIGGTLRFATNQTTRLRVGTLIVLPNGALEVGTSSSPIPASFTAEIIIKNKALNTSADPDQFGTGLLSIDGKVTMYGAVKTPTFVRTASEPRAGQTVIQLERAVSGWRVGDRLFVPDTRQVDENNKFNSSYVLQIDEVTVQSISADGRSVTVSPALRYDHQGARDADGTPTVLSDGTKLLPHVGNLTRNVIIRSENPSGTRGHTLFTNRSDVDIYYVQFQDLGRTRTEPLNSSTNHIGRYPLHAHHLWGAVNASNTGYQFELVGNAVNDSLKWPMAIHGSHYGLVKWNVVFGGSQLTGAGIAVEDGSETENLFEENFVANIRSANISPRQSEPNTADGTTPGSAAECFWGAGFNNRFINNVASDCRNPVQEIVSGVGWKLITPAAPYTTSNPRFRGADMTNTAQTVSVTPQYQPILEFRGNEVYGGSAVGLTIWNLGTDGYDLRTMPETLIKDLRVWNVYEAAIWNYPVNQVTIDNLVHRIDPSGILYWEASIQSGDYRDINLTIRGGSIHAGGVFGGTEAVIGTIRIENVRAITRDHAFSFKTPKTPGTQAGIPDPPGTTVIMRNNVVSPWPGQPLRTVGMNYDADGFTNKKYEVYVHDYQGQAGNDFRVYWREQATQNIAGGIAPCNNTTARPEISGITCPMTGATSPPSDTTAPSTPSNLLVSAISSSQINLSWTASTDNVGVTGYRVERCQGSTCTAFTQIGSPSGTSYSDTGLSANTTYRYRVRTTDAAGNLSAYSSIVNGTTQALSPPSAGLSCSTVGMNAFYGCYYNNIDFTGLALTRTDPIIDFDWGSGSPDSLITSDTFSVKWEGDFDFPTAGSYRFSATVDDGIRVSVDGGLILNRWQDQSATTYTADVNLTGGKHRVKVEYYENGGDAVARVSWALVAPPPTGPAAPTDLVVK